MTSGRRVGIARAAHGEYRDRDAVLRLVQKATAAAFDTNAPHALGHVLPRGAKILLKPNWVHHENRSGASTDCLVTHLAFIEAVLREVLAAKPARVTIADAPIQGADFDRLVPRAWRQHVAELGGEIPVAVIDLRNVIRVRRGGQVVQVRTSRDPERVVIFDLASSSLLEEVSQRAGVFRCTSYDPERIIAIQRAGVHKYAICKEPLEADVVINLPKLKTHGKAGLTGALKNLVGINGDKDYLPHHRIGSPSVGGDCYEQPHVAKRVTELLLDAANRRIGRPGHRIASAVAGLAVRFSRGIGRGGIEGAWYGNDTVWRMTLDLNRILLYGRPDGTMSDEIQRSVITITDAIVAGQGEGPLEPEPMRLGAVTCATNAAYADLTHAALMGFDWQRIPLVREAFRSMQWPIAAGSADELVCVEDGRVVRVEQLQRRRFNPPAGWRGYVEHAAG